jgi:hypothetical protein
MMKFESKKNNGEEPIVYHRKVLALYEDNEVLGEVTRTKVRTLDESHT